MDTSFFVLGGDLRQAYLAKSLFEDGAQVSVCAVDSALLPKEIKPMNISEGIKASQNIILPIPALKNGVLNGNFSEKIIPDNSFISMLKNKTVFCGRGEELLSVTPKWHEVNLFDYGERENFKIKNALPSAEGAIKVAIEEYESVLQGARCLISGYGKIGKELSKKLSALGCIVTVSARSNSDFEFAANNKQKCVYTGNIKNHLNADIIFNTVPSLVFDKDILSDIDEGTLYIELASAPGGIDKKSAEQFGVRIIAAQSLPGKFSPKTAGEIIKETIYEIMEEMY